MTRHVKSPARWDERRGEAAVFLAGGITGCPDWQAEAADRLTEHAGFFVLNPRRADWTFDTGDEDAARAQITWEFQALRRANVVMFWFPASTGPQPIALYELGHCVGQRRRLAVGCHPRYPRRLDVVTQLDLARPKLRVRDSLREVVEDAQWLLSGGAGWVEK